MAASDRDDASRDADQKSFSMLGASKGGRARASVLTDEERSAIAKKAARARWGKDQVEAPNDLIDAAVARPGPTDRPVWATTSLPFSMFQGTITFGTIEAECHVLSNHKRVFTQREVVRIISEGRDSGNIQRYLGRVPTFVDFSLEDSTSEFLVPPVGQRAAGYDAEALVDICDRYLRAREAGDLKGPQLKLAKQAEIVTRVCAKIGIIALIDEATGYQQVRAKQALQLKLQAFIADELQEWARMFPDEFWFELARLEGVRYQPRARPLRWGRYIMMFVYDAVDEDIGRELRKKNPNPRFLRNHHQWLKKHGREKVNDQIQRVIAVMKLCGDMRDFKDKFSVVFQKSPAQLSFDDVWNG